MASKPNWQMILAAIGTLAGVIALKPIIYDPFFSTSANTPHLPRQSENRQDRQEAVDSNFEKNIPPQDLPIVSTTEEQVSIPPSIPTPENLQKLKNKLALALKMNVYSSQDAALILVVEEALAASLEELAFEAAGHINIYASKDIALGKIASV